MTIYTPKPAEKKEEKVIPIADVDGELLPEKQDNYDNEELAEGIPQIVAVRRRRSNTANFCIMITATIVLVAGVMGGIYLYKHFTHRTYTGFCGVSYYDNQDLLGDNFDPEAQYSQGWVDGVGGRNRKRHFGRFEEKIELDKDGGTFEKIDVPAFEECKKATILHDFEKNWTAIVDKDNGHCFILPLNRTMVKPPKDFWDLINKLKTGYYMPDAEIVREEYQVTLPPITSLGNYGYYIWRECRYYDSFKLKKVIPGEPIALARKKRSTAPLHYASFDGKIVNQYDISM